MASLIRSALFLILLLIGIEAGADDQRAQVNYLIHCQGCHLHDAVGVPDRVPRMKEFVGYFLYSKAGREFLIRVPGVSTASLPDDQIAELMNWIIMTYSVQQMPEEFVPYTEAEVAGLRKKPESDPASTRQAILADIAADSPTLAQALADKRTNQ